METELPGVKYEHIFIDNNSKDLTVEIISDICFFDENVKLLVNSKNVGALKSMFLAMQESSGRAVIPMLPADLQDPVDVIPNFYTGWLEGNLVVYGVRKNRKENYILRKTRTLYYKIIQKLAKNYIPLNAGEFLIADRKVINSILATKDHEPYIRGMIANTGVKSMEIEYDMKMRKKGKSKSNLFYLIDTAINGFVGTSRIPARLILFSGFILSLFGITIAMLSSIFKVITDVNIGQFITNEMILIIIIGGFQIFFIGIIGEYVLSLHSQVRREPESFFTIKKNFNKI